MQNLTSTPGTATSNKSATGENKWEVSELKNKTRMGPIGHWQLAYVHTHAHTLAHKHQGFLLGLEETAEMWTELSLGNWLPSFRFWCQS